MEAKVDIRKLQILNDRITQALDALNQVRLSVHGLGHTGAAMINPFVGAQPANAFGMGLGTGYPQFFGGTQPFVTQPWGQFGGLAHSGAQSYPFYGQQSIQDPRFLGQVGGLYHSGPDVIEQRVLELRATDPQRLLQTFPFAWSIQSPLTGGSY